MYKELLIKNALNPLMQSNKRTREEELDCHKVVQ